ncbi:FeoC-like transcriptional regulator [Clostridium sp.]|uniref:FeoC-like transcriptional regulator n=1 Tax=Clostridium sp. TaxID=1506 RepID=UPI002FDCB906
MLIKLLNIFNQGETYSLEDIANMLKAEVNTVKAQLEYLENHGYIRKVIGGTNCNTDCTHCRNKNGNRGGLVMWEINRLL